MKTRRRDYTNKQLSMLVEDILNIAERIEKVSANANGKAVTVYCGATVVNNLGGLRRFARLLENHEKDTAARRYREEAASAREAKLRNRIDRMSGELDRMTRQLDKISAL